MLRDNKSVPKNLGGLIKWTKIQTTAIHKKITQAKMRTTIQTRMRITIQAKTQTTIQITTQTRTTTKLKRRNPQNRGSFFKTLFLGTGSQFEDKGNT